MSSEMGRLYAVSTLAFRGSLTGLRLVALAAFALVPSIIVAALVSAHPSGTTLSGAAEVLFAELTLPIVNLLIVLVLFVSQFRTEIDAETLVYLSDRSATRPAIVLGKYAGGVAASLAFGIPAALLPLAIAEVGGGTPYAAAVPLTFVAVTILATLAYGAFFLFLGLVTRSALLIGLIYGILWEELLNFLPGDVPQLTVLYYLHSLLSWELPSGPLSGFPTSDALAVVIVAPIAVAIAFLTLASGVFRYVETAPERESA
jgi:ABC-2 type transport system permease protein